MNMVEFRSQPLTGPSLGICKIYVALDDLPELGCTLSTRMNYKQSQCEVLSSSCVDDQGLILLV